MKINPKRFAGLRLTERDLDMLRLLFEYKTADAKRIKSFCYPTADICDVRKRLKRFEMAKLIASRGLVENKKIYKIFRLTPKGRSFLGEEHDKYVNKYKLETECPFHDLTLLDIGKRLRSSETVEEYLTENLLQSGNYCRNDRILRAFVVNRSDACLKLKFQGEDYNVAVEYERTAKQPKRYESLVNDYHNASSVDAIFYFYRNDRIRQFICQYEEDNWPKSRPKFYFCKLESGSDLPPTLTLTDRTGDSIVL